MKERALSHGGNTMLYKVSSLFSNTSRSAINTISNAGMVSDKRGNSAGRISNSMSSYGPHSGYFNEGNNSAKSGYMQDKLSGK